MDGTDRALGEQTPGARTLRTQYLINATNSLLRPSSSSLDRYADLDPELAEPVHSARGPETSLRTAGHDPASE